MPSKYYPIFQKHFHTFPRHEDTENLSALLFGASLVDSLSLTTHLQSYVAKHAKKSELDAFIWELHTAFPTENWTKYFGMPVRFFESGFLFRGDSRSPDVIFTEGFTLRSPFHSMAKASGYITDDEGISFSKSLDVAKRYAFATHGPYQVYIIDAPEHCGIDTMMTGIERKKAAKYLTKSEVNFISPVPANRIVGVICYNETQEIVAIYQNIDYCRAGAGIFSSLLSELLILHPIQPLPSQIATPLSFPPPPLLTTREHGFYGDAFPEGTAGGGSGEERFDADLPGGAEWGR